MRHPPPAPPAAARHRTASIAAERARLFYQAGTPEGQRLVRHLHALAVPGAAAVGLVSWCGAGSRPGPILRGCGTAPISHVEILTRLTECAHSLDRQFNAIMGVAETDSAVQASTVTAIPLQHVRK